MNLLEAIRDIGLPIRYYQASSSEQYGKVIETPQTEKTPFYPRSPYACRPIPGGRPSTKPTRINGILFNHESPAGARRCRSPRPRPASRRLQKLSSTSTCKNWGFGSHVEAMNDALHTLSRTVSGETHSVHQVDDLLRHPRPELGLNTSGRGIPACSAGFTNAGGDSGPPTDET